MSEVYSTTGAYDLLAQVQVHGYENLSDVVNDKIANLRGIRDTRTVTTFKQYKFRQLHAGAAPAPATALGAPGDAGTETARAQLARGRRRVAPILAKLSDNFNLDRAPRRATCWPTGARSRTPGTMASAGVAGISGH